MFINTSVQRLVISQFDLKFINSCVYITSYISGNYNFVFENVMKQFINSQRGQGLNE